MSPAHFRAGDMAALLPGAQDLPKRRVASTVKLIAKKAPPLRGS